MKSILVDSLSLLQTLGLYKAKDPKKQGLECGKCIFDSGSETMYDIENSEKVNQTFEIDGVKCQIDEKHVDDLFLHNSSVPLKIMTPSV